MAQSCPALFQFGSRGGNASGKDDFSFEFTAGSSSSSGARGESSGATETLARDEYLKTYCDSRGKQTVPFDADVFRKDLQRRRSVSENDIANVVNKLDAEIPFNLLKQFRVNEHGFPEGVYRSSAKKLQTMRPDLTRKGMVAHVDEVQETMVTSTSASSTAPIPDQDWVCKEFSTRYCDGETGELLQLPDFDEFCTILQRERPGHDDFIAEAVGSLDRNYTRERLSNEDFADMLVIAHSEYSKAVRVGAIRESCEEELIQVMKRRCPNFHEKVLERVVREWTRRVKKSQDSSKPQPQTTMPQNRAAASKPASMAVNQDLTTWVYEQYLNFGFNKGGFKGFAHLSQRCQNLKPHQRREIIEVISKLRRPPPGAQYSFGDPNQVAQEKKRERLALEASAKGQPAATSATVRQVPSVNPRQQGFSGDPDSPSPNPYIFNSNDDFIPFSSKNEPKTRLLTKKPNQLHRADAQHHDRDLDSGIDVPSPRYDEGSGLDESSDEDEDSDDSTEEYSDASSEIEPEESEHEHGDHRNCRGGEDDKKENSADESTIYETDHDGMSELLSDNSDVEADEESDRFDAEILHAPLLDGEMISTGRHLLPQYGLMGSHKELNVKSRMFLNTNIPFSAFICGVQGSGKSHTTATILENSLIPSKNLGHLESPLSALVFSYGHFSGDGSGYSISEAAFLAAPSPQFPDGAHIKKVNVLVAPSNFMRISKLYLCIPNVTVTKFMLNPADLDIDTMLTLMNVNESDEQPLYMAQVTQILREMATSGSKFNYKIFKRRVEEQRFNPAQECMLQMRLNLLESFLDMKNSCPPPQFKPGEITIMDMSCPFVDANTACILFRIGLVQYLRSGAAGKMIVLDEAHKYVIDVPGAKSLNAELLHTVRLQRHFGARIVISTQEPTLLTDLIALCSIIVIHRFSSPEWFSAIKRHIPIDVKDRENLMRTIECLKTGTALVYAPNAVLGWKTSGSKDGEDNITRRAGLVMGTGRMMKVSVRKRITSDGGQSILAV